MNGLTNHINTTMFCESNLKVSCFAGTQGIFRLVLITANPVRPKSVSVSRGQSRAAATDGKAHEIPNVYKYALF